MRRVVGALRSAGIYVLIAIGDTVGSQFSAGIATAYVAYGAKTGKPVWWVVGLIWLAWEVLFMVPRREKKLFDRRAKLIRDCLDDGYRLGVKLTLAQTDPLAELKRKVDRPS